MSYTYSPVAGAAIAVRLAVVILGINNPDVVEVMSSIALATGAAPEALIATFCENTRAEQNMKARVKFFFMNSLLYLYKIKLNYNLLFRRFISAN